MYQKKEDAFANGHTVRLRKKNSFSLEYFQLPFTTKNLGLWLAYPIFLIILLWLRMHPFKSSNHIELSKLPMKVSLNKRLLWYLKTFKYQILLEFLIPILCAIVPLAVVLFYPYITYNNDSLNMKTRRCVASYISHSAEYTSTSLGLYRRYLICNTNFVSNLYM